MPRFVVLRHESPSGLHWDLMLESGQMLKTWQLPQEPSAGVSLEATPLPDHRPHYLDYEGPISGDRGQVARFDAGAYDLLASSETRWEVRLHGVRLVGMAQLLVLPDSPGRWQFSLRVES